MTTRTEYAVRLATGITGTVDPMDSAAQFVAKCAGYVGPLDRLGMSPTDYWTIYTAPDASVVVQIRESVADSLSAERRSIVAEWSRQEGLAAVKLWGAIVQTLNPPPAELYRTAPHSREPAILLARGKPQPPSVAWASRAELENWMTESRTAIAVVRVLGPWKGELETLASLATSTGDLVVGAIKSAGQIVQSAANAVKTVGAFSGVIVAGLIGIFAIKAFRGSK